MAIIVTATSGFGVDVTGISVGMTVAVASRVAVIGGRAVFVAGNVAVNTGVRGPDVTEARQPQINQMNRRIIKRGCRFMILHVAQPGQFHLEARESIPALCFETRLQLLTL